MTNAKASRAKIVPTYCYNCVAGPDLLTVKVVNGIAREIGPNYEALRVEPVCAKPCVKAYGLIQKLYNPHRVMTPMRRTNPRKGINEDPGFVAISWDEALEAIAARLKEIRSRGVVDENGLPRVAASFGNGGTPAFYMGSFPAFLAAWGPVDFSFGSGQGVKCVHSEHVYGEYWHRAFTVAADTPLVNYILSFGGNHEVTGGAAAVHRHAAARARGVKRVQIEPHLSVTGACSARWIPIKPKTDAAFMLALLHVMVHEHPRERLDLAFLRERTASPYLVGPNGFLLREPESGKPLVWDETTQRAVTFDADGVKPALEGTFKVERATEIGADNELFEHRDVDGATQFLKLVEHLRPYDPRWAEKVCAVPAGVIRELADEYLTEACVGSVIELDGVTLPLRPVAVVLGKTVNNGWGGYECVWARTMLALLVGALEVPGGILGTTVRLNRPQDDRLQSVKPGPDGFMQNLLNPTDRENWAATPTNRNAHRSLVPLVGNGAWSQALGPSHLAWLFQNEAPRQWPKPALPDLWFVYRTNPAISFWDSKYLSETMSRMPFVVCFAYTRDETNHMADILLPDATDLEGLQLIRFGGTKYVEHFTEHQGVVLRQPVVAPRGESRDMSWIATELARRTGLLERYVGAINKGAGMPTPLTGKNYDFALAPEKEPTVEQIWDAACKAATAALSDGREIRDLAWFREHGFYARPFKHVDWYLYPTMVAHGLRFELPYQERLMRAGLELGRRLHESGIQWWDEQLKEYMALPAWHDLPGLWEKALIRSGADPQEYPFWLITTKSMQYTAGNNAAIQLMHEVSQNVRGHGGLVMNAATARSLKIEPGDWVEISSPYASTRGRAILVQGIRPDTMLTVGQFDHWITPYAKDLHAPSLNTVAPILLELTDATGSGADLVRITVRKLTNRTETATLKRAGAASRARQFRRAWQ
jgi:phenylacetyl-CoA:acceptor oxidoreductase